MKNLFLLAAIWLMISAIDAQTVRSKDSYGEKVYYFEGIPEKWVIICLIR